MDTLAHGLWAYLLGRSARAKERWMWLGLISSGPDFVWLPFTFVTLITQGRLHFFTLPYQVSHSLVIWFVVTLLASLRWKNFWHWSWPWALHILIDMIGHIAPSDQTPFLWPISNFSIRGAFDWLTIKLLLINYFCLGIFYFTVRMRERKQKFDEKR